MIGPMALYDQVDTGVGISVRLSQAIVTQLADEESLDTNEPNIPFLEHLANSRLVELFHEKGVESGVSRNVLLRYAMRYVLVGLNFGMFVVRRMASIVVSLVRTLIYQIGRILLRFVITPILTGLGAFFTTPVGIGVAAVLGVVGGGYLLYRYIAGDEDVKDEEHNISPIVLIGKDGQLHPQRAKELELQFRQDSAFDVRESEGEVVPERRPEPAAPLSQEAMQHEARRATTVTGGLSEASLVKAMDSSGMTDPIERAMFLAQMSHESGGFKYAEEIWGPTAAQRRYEGRKDLGNIHPGDGYRYRGRGYIQLTGRANYKEAGDYLGIDLVGNPDLAAQGDIAALIALWYWRVARRGIPSAARRGDIRRVTYLINGGYNGLRDRQRRFQRYLAREEQAIQLAKASVPKSASLDVTGEEVENLAQEEKQSSGLIQPNSTNSTYARYKGVIVKAPT